jgi:hypothetical protein
MQHVAGLNLEEVAEDVCRKWQIKATVAAKRGLADGWRVER